MCLNGGLSEVMLLGFVLFCLFVGLKKKFNTEWLGNKGLRKEYSTNVFKFCLSLSTKIYKQECLMRVCR